MSPMAVWLIMSGFYAAQARAVVAPAQKPSDNPAGTQRVIELDATGTQP